MEMEMIEFFKQFMGAPLQGTNPIFRSIAKDFDKLYEQNHQGENMLLSVDRFKDVMFSSEYNLMEDEKKLKTLFDMMFSERYEFNDLIVMYSECVRKHFPEYTYKVYLRPQLDKKYHVFLKKYQAFDDQVFLEEFYPEYQTVLPYNHRIVMIGQDHNTRLLKGNFKVNVIKIP